VNPLPSKKVRELDALFGKSLLPQDDTAKRAATTSKPEPAADPVLAGTEITDDDIPF
jgi:hypothetical protein